MMASPVWLASGSPRRRMLLEWAGIGVEVCPSNIDETRRPTDRPVEHAQRLAAAKAAVGPAERTVLAADTVVHLDDNIFDKPTDRDQARAHLRALSGKWHDVTTGVCVARAGDARVFSVTTRVRFRELTPLEIDRYLATGEADDKAGGYGIQARGALFVAAVDGSYTNVIGLPVEETLDALERFGVSRDR